MRLSQLVGHAYLSDGVNLTASGFYRCNSRLGCLIDGNRQCDIELTRTEQLTGRSPYEPNRQRSELLCPLSGRSELIQITDVDDLVFSTKDIGETTLRQTLDQRHLTAFKSTANMTAFASLLTLMTATGSFSIAGAGQ